MVQTITEKNEVYIGGTVYPIIGKVQRSKASGWPSKVVIGDYAAEDEPILSSWVIDDQRGGILVEEMDESIHADKCWWSNLILSFKSSLTLPRLTTQITLPITTEKTITDGNLEIWTSSSVLTNWTTATATLAQQTSGPNQGTYFARLGSNSGYIYQDLDTTQIQGRRFTFTAYAKGSAASKAKIGIDDGATTTYSSYNAGTSWEQLSVSKTMAAAATRLRLICYYDSGGADYAYFDGAMTITRADDILPIGTPVNFNSELYYPMGKLLTKLNSAGTELTAVNEFTADITALVPSVGNILYIFLGDADEYWYMTTAEVFTEASAEVTNTRANSTAYALKAFVNPATFNGYVYECTTAGTSAAGAPTWPTTEGTTVTDGTVVWTCRSANATKAIHWDSKLFKMDSEGLISYSVAPNSATPTWVPNGSLADVGIADNETNELFIYFDADGDQIIYATTQRGLFAHDYSNAKWRETAVELAQHTNSGKGAEVWHDAAFISSGLSVKKYIAGNTATISSRGLDQDDGLPTEYQGEIVKFIKGDNEFFACVDASEATGTNYSGLYAYDELGWQCWWVGATADDTMHGGIVSTAGAASSRKVYFDHDDKVYSIDLQRSIRKPKQISTFTYTTAGIHISPWFDADTAHNKLAVRFKIELKDITAAETVIVKYRINHINTDRDTGWTTLATIDATELGAAYGEKEYTFGTNAGIVFRAIQFRFDLARGSTTTLSPVIIKASLGFWKLLPIKWGFNVTVDCSRGYRDKTSAELIAALDTLVETQTLSEFTYRDESGGTFTYYIQALNAQALEETGRTFTGEYQIALVEP